MNRRQDDKTFTNHLGEYVALSNEVFEIMFGAEFNSQRIAKDVARLDFSGPKFALETLTGKDPMRNGLMDDQCRVIRNYVQVLNIGRNQLTDIKCIDLKQRDGTPEFRSLNILIASRNQLTEVSLTLDNLLELNLAHNELTTIPPMGGLKNLQKLILAHNKISDTLREFDGCKKLRELYLHDNLFSWKPTEFERQMQILASNHLYKLTVWPNPFAENFTEYQFLAVTRIETLSSLDGYDIDSDLRAELRKLEETMRSKNALDYTVFDMKVAERSGGKSASAHSDEDYVDLARVPTLEVLLRALDRPLDHPNELIKYVYEFKTRVGFLWGARYSDRVKQLEIKDKREEELQVREFCDKMQQLLGRYDSAQDALVECLVRLCASGNTSLSTGCAVLLSEWVDALPGELQANLASIAEPLFRELRTRLLPGMQSFEDDPSQCMEVYKARMTPETQALYDDGFFGDNDAIAESAEILGALSTFGRASFAPQSSMGRSTILEPLLAALCRPPRKELGKEKGRDKRQFYEGYGAYPGANFNEKESIKGPVTGFVDSCYGRCVKRNLGGFVVREDSPGILTADFYNESSDALRGMRRKCEGRTLYVVESVARLRAPQELGIGMKEALTWDVWRNGLHVLTVASQCRGNARKLVRQFNLHQAIIQHEQQVFTESLLNVTPEATVVFTQLLNLAANLMTGPPGAAAIARDAFFDAKLHTNCWERVRRRLTEGGGAIARSRLKTAKPEFTLLVSALVRVVFEMSHEGNHAAAVVKDLCDGQDDVFNMMLDIAADTDVPDPLLLTAGLETLHMFLAHDRIRNQVLGGQTIVSKILTRLHEMQILLPYIRGPRLKDANNNKYQDLWYMCEMKYASDKHIKERFPQLFDASGMSGDWRERCPELRDLHNPLMHRVLLAIVRLIELFSDQAGRDSTGELNRVCQMLDDNDREKLLIGPSCGLVLVPDFDVKIEVLKVIQHVLESAPDQFQPQEMGWLLRYLQSTGMGVGRQEDFLMEVLKLIQLLIQDPDSTGFKFREKFAKQAIRQAYEMLNANIKRDVTGAKDEEESKTALSLQIVTLLRACSMPVSGGLRPFLRRTDFLEVLKGVMLAEDQETGQKGVREPLLRTWTGREMREVLLPLVTMNSLAVTGVGRYRSLVRMADVLQGKTDYDPADKRIPFASTDESLMWMGIQKMKLILQVDDEYFKTDCETQQREFVASGGLDGLISFGERALAMHEKYVDIGPKVKVQIETMTSNQYKVVSNWWDDYVYSDAGRKKRTKAEDDDEEDVAEAKMDQFLETRMVGTNSRLELLYKTSVKFFDERRGKSTLELVGILLKGFVEENHKTHLRWRDDLEHQKAYQDLQAHENMYWTKQSKLEYVSVMKKENTQYAKVRQPSATTLEALVEQNIPAQMVLKKLLIARGDGAKPEVQKWAETVWESETLASTPATPEEGPPDDMNAFVRDGIGLVEFLSDFGCTAYDPGYRTENNIWRQMKYKYLGDYSRVRNVARMVLEFKDPHKLLECLKKLKDNTRFSVVTVRNRFRDGAETALGQRNVTVYIEVLSNQVKFICELLMVINEAQPGEYLSREKNYRDETAKLLRDICKVKIEDLEQYTDFIFYEMNSSSIRHLDLVYIRTGFDDSKIIIANKKSVAAEDELNSRGQCDATQRNLFYIERQIGEDQENYGTVRTGDTVNFKNFLSKNYIDASMTNYGIRCRFDNPDESNASFVIEDAPEIKEKDAILGLTMFASQDGAIAPATEQDKKAAKKKANQKHKPPNKNLHHNSAIILKVDGSATPVRRLSVRPPDGWSSSYLNLKAEKKEPDNKCETQIFYTCREGALDVFFKVTKFKEVQDDDAIKSLYNAKTDDQNQEKTLLLAYMAPTLKTQAPEEGGIFRRKPPSFKDIAVRQAINANLAQKKLHKHLVSEEELEEEEDDEGPDILNDAQECRVDTKNLPSLTIAAIMRCIYSLLELPTYPDVRIFGIDETLGKLSDHGPKAKFSRLLTLVVSMTTAPDLGYVSEESIIVSWLSAKLMRTFSAAFKRMPALSLPAHPRKEKLNLPDGGKAEQAEKEEKGQFDQQRLGVMKTYAAYISEIIGATVRHRLAQATQRPMSRSEVTMMVEICSAVNVIARMYYSNELRCKPRDQDEKAKNELEGKAEEAEKKLTNVAKVVQEEGSLAAIPGLSLATGALTGGFSGVTDVTSLAAGGLAGAITDIEEELEGEDQDRSCIRGEMEAQIFASLVPSGVLMILVHAFLHGMRMEALAYASQRNIANETQECVKLTSSLVQRSIHALAICMHGCEGSPATSCDYNVCEAISQALSLGAQFVPRARVTQLMNEWKIEKHRKAVEDYLKKQLTEPDYYPDGTMSNWRHLQTKPTERCFLLGFVWHARFTLDPNDRADLGATDRYGAAQDAEPRLLVITSRMNLVIFKVRPEDVTSANGVPEMDQLDVVAIRNLARVQRIVSHPRMRQFLGVMWDEPSKNKFCEAFIFESYYRKRDFHDALRLVQRFRPRASTSDLPEEKLDFEGKDGAEPRMEQGAHKHIPETLVKEKLLLYLRKCCKPKDNPRSEAQLVTVAFVRNVPSYVYDTGMDVLVMTRDALCCISVSDFLRFWAISECDTKSPSKNAKDEEDSDSDEDGIPPPTDGEEMDELDITTMGKSMRGPFTTKSLSGVWFLAKEEPTIGFQFKSKEEITFFSDGDRQRFRQHLACVLRLDDEAGQGHEIEQGKLWRVQPTGETELTKVTKQVKETEVKLAKHVDHVKKMAQLALRNSPDS